jgi:triacylglycerol esterase/lipase EstA (alpha/beta hydrolase family)
MSRLDKLDRLVSQARRLAADWLDLDGRHNQVERRTDLDGHPRPVLLLHGFFSTRRTFDVLERRLRRDGYGVFSLNLGGLRRAYNTRGIDDLADLVRAKVERAYAHHPGLGPLTIVGHSKGGVVAAYYVKKLGGWRRARAVVTLGAPFHGTPKAWLGLPIALLAPSIPQLLPGSDFLRRLHDGRWPPQVRLTSLWSKRDTLAIWPSPVVDPAGNPRVRNVEVDCRHLEFLTRKAIYGSLREELERAALAERAPLSVLAGGRTG